MHVTLIYGVCTGIHCSTLYSPIFTLAAMMVNAVDCLGPLTLYVCNLGSQISLPQLPSNLSFQVTILNALTHPKLYQTGKTNCSRESNDTIMTVHISDFIVVMKWSYEHNIIITTTSTIIIPEWLGSMCFRHCFSISVVNFWYILAATRYPHSLYWQQLL